MLSVQEIEQNKNKVIELLTSVGIQGADIQGLINWLNSTDFFYAPASTQYHCNYDGGLCYHSLNVYNNLVTLANLYAPGKYSNDTLIIVGLLHDLAKVNFYEKYNRNVKDENGKWTQVQDFRVRDAHSRFLGGEHGFNSMILINQYIPLTYEETLAVLHHHAGLGEAKQLGDLSAITNKYSLVALLHMADYLSTFIIERQ